MRGGDWRPDGPRSATRLVFFETRHEGLGVARERNVAKVVPMLAQAGALLACFPWRGGEAERT